MNKNDIKTVLRELYEISGFRVSLHGINYEEIAAYPEQKLAFCNFIQKHSPYEYQACVRCDKDACKNALATGETKIYKCRHGLVEAISPLYSFGALTGFLMMGQVLDEAEGSNNIISTLVRMGKTDFESRSMSAAIPTVKNSMINHYVHILTICAQYLTLSNAITNTKPTVPELVLRYISEHYRERITIKDICDALKYSKSTVLTSFKKEYRTTVNSYINNMRLNEAKKLLENGNRTINEIALLTGFSDQSYFSKVFSAKYGASPSEYRKRGDI